jgi:hypothetical protein
VIDAATDEELGSVEIGLLAADDGVAMSDEPTKLTELDTGVDEAASIVEAELKRTTEEEETPELSTAELATGVDEAASIVKAELERMIEDEEDPAPHGKPVG